MPIGRRAPNLECALEREIAEKWSLTRTGWDHFCCERVPGQDLYTCCLRYGHEGEVHIVFSVEPRIMYRWTSSGTMQD